MPIYAKEIKTKRDHTNIYTKRMGDKTNQNKRNTTTQSNRGDQLNTSYPLTHKNGTKNNVRSCATEKKKIKQGSIINETKFSLVK